MNSTAKNHLNWGILGLASIAPAMAKAVEASERSSVLAAASRDLAKADSFAKAHDIPRAYGSYEELIDDPDIDVVYIPLPNNLHGEWIVRALKAGKNVLCEKPLVTSAAELDEIQTIAEAAGLTVAEAFMSLHHPQAQAAKALLDSGAIGQPKFVQAWFGYEFPLGERGDIRLREETHGGGFWDVGVYPNSYISYLLGAAPESVTAVKVSSIHGVDTGFAGQLLFPDEVIAQIWCSLETFFQQGVRVVGKEGVLEIPVPWMPGMTDRTELGEDSVIKITTVGGTEVITLPASNPFLAEVTALESQVLDGIQPIVSPSMSRTFLRSALALQEAATNGSIVNLIE
jgi:D-xylose 1-dehydrogenase (NADP+, D-xylono-1,5-lactone-forming)